MREILFRGKRKDNGEWVEGYFCRKYFSELPHDRCVIQYKTECTKEWRPDYMVAEVIPETVGQYTGLTDKNGKKLFEGDIVKDSFLLGKVVYATPQDGFDGIAGFMVDDVFDGLQNYNGFWHQVEVIGNIHDNPDLLKGGE